MSQKTSQLQIRVSPDQKAALKRLAAEAGLNLSQYVLATVLPHGQAEFARLARDIAERETRRASLAKLQGYLAELGPEELSAAVADLDPGDLSPVLQNYLAATVEEASRSKGVAPPAWATRILPLDRPHFGWELRSLRPHLMRITPIAFKRRNVFVDAEGVETSRGRVAL